MTIYQINLNRSLQFILFECDIENINLFLYQTMLDPFSPIFNSTNLPIAATPLSPSLKTSNPLNTSLKQANLISFPGQNITNPKYFFTYCSHCSSKDQQESQLIWPCKCLTPVHVHCLQNKISSNLDKLRSNKIKCNICKQPYKIEVEQKWHVDITQIFKCQRNIISYFIVLVLLLTGILSLSISLHSLYLRHSQKQQHSNSYQDNQMDLQKNISSENEAPNDKNTDIQSTFQIEVMVIVGICCLTVIFMMIMTNFCKHHLLKKRAVIVKICSQINSYPLSQ